MNSVANTSKGKILWLLDNGHGIDTPGKRSPMLMDGRQFLEYKFNREVVLMMLTLLERKELHSLQLVPEEKDVTLRARVERANACRGLQPCVLVSVHSNAYGNGSSFTVPRGIASYYHEASEAGKRIARVFQENLKPSSPRFTTFFTFYMTYSLSYRIFLLCHL